MDASLHMTAVVSGMGCSWRGTGTRLLDYKVNLIQGSVEFDYTRPEEAKLHANPPDSPVMVIYLLPV
jgi:hypothetical protein